MDENIFSPLLMKGYYLSFLNWQDCEEALNNVHSIICDYPGQVVHDNLLALLEEDWRPTLVALIAILMLSKEKSAQYSPILWKKLIKYSWVSPQMAVVLSLIDDDFYIKIPTFIAKKKISAQTKNALHYLNGLPELSPCEDQDGGYQLARDWRANIPIARVSTVTLR